MRIEHNGPAPVRQFFVVQDDATHSVLGDVAAAPFDVGLNASFRGRLLCGQRRRLPPQCSGVVMRADEQESDATQAWSVAHAFDELFVWQREQPIAAADKINTWLAWPALARVVNRPLTSDDVAAAATRVAAGEFKRADADAASSSTTKRKRTDDDDDGAAVAANPDAVASTASPRRSPARAVKAAEASPRRSPRVSATSTPAKRKAEKMRTPATETKAAEPKMTTPPSDDSPQEKRRRVVRRLDDDDDDDE